MFRSCFLAWLIGKEANIPLDIPVFTGTQPVTEVKFRNFRDDNDGRVTKATNQYHVQI